MNADIFYSYLINPSQISETSSKELDSVIAEFPYFETAYLLQAKAANNNKSIHYATKLKQASIYANDRIRLYDLLTKTTAEIFPVEVISDKKIELKVIEAVVEVKEIIETKVEEKEIILEIKTAEPTEVKEIVIETKIEDKETIPEIIIAETVVETKTIVEEKETIPEIIIIETVTEIKTIVTETTIEIETTEKLVEEKSIETKELNVPFLAEQISKIIPVEIKEKNSEAIPHQPVNAEIKTKEHTIISPTIEKLSNKKHALDNVEKEILSEVINQHAIEEVELIEPQIKTEELKDKTQEEASIDFNKAHSFTEWLKLAQFNKQNQPHNSSLLAKTENINPKVSLQKKVAQLNLIERFIETEPKIAKPKKTEFFNPINKARESAEEDLSLTTETLAKIYLQQGNSSKALKAYEHLSLKFPEKSAYFASQIEKIKEQLKK